MARLAAVIVSLRYPGFAGVRVRVVSSCWLDFTDVRNSIIYFFCFLAIDNDIMRKMCTLITSKGTNIQQTYNKGTTKIMLPVHRNRGILNSLLMCDSHVFGASHVSHFMQTQDYWYFQIITIINWQFQHCIVSHFVFCVRTDL